MAKGKPHMNLVFIGHVDHGKSTTVGRLLYDTGNVDEQTMRKLKDTAKEVGKVGFEFAFVMDNLKEERELIRKVLYFEDLVKIAARDYAPNYMTKYLQDIASDFHSYYNKNRIVTDNPDFVINNNGNVGIGTTGPGGKLTVYDSGNTQLKIGRDSGADYRIGRNSSSGILEFYGQEVGATGFQFSTYAGDWMKITELGNVGIGTTVPTTQLDITKVSGQATMQMQSGSDVGAYLQLERYGSNGNYFNIQTGTANRDTLEIWGGGINLVTVQPGGNVGIGTTGSEAKLDVAGTATLRKASLSVMSGLVSIDEGTVNLHTNPGLELGTTSGWSFDPKTDGSLDTYSTDKLSGSYCARIKNSTAWAAERPRVPKSGWCRARARSRSTTRPRKSIFATA